MDDPQTHRSAFHDVHTEHYPYVLGMHTAPA